MTANKANKYCPIIFGVVKLSSEVLESGSVSGGSLWKVAVVDMAPVDKLSVLVLPSVVVSLLLFLILVVVVVEVVGIDEVVESNDEDVADVDA